MGGDRTVTRCSGMVSVEDPNSLLAAGALVCLAAHRGSGGPS